MKTMRKIFTLMLVMTMLLSMAITANATTVDPYDVVPTAIMDAGTITIKGSAAGTQYTIYRIFDIAQISNGEIVYLVNDNWKDFVNASDYFTIVNGYVKDITLTDAQLQEFAAAAMDWAEEKGIGFDGQSSELLNSGDYTTKNAYQYGYYIMTSNRQAHDFKYSVFTLDQENITVREKSTVNVDITKQVQEDSEITQPGKGWGDENNAEIGQEVHFKIVVTVAAGSDPYIITDSMPKFKDIEIEEYRFSNGNIQEGYISYEATADGFKITLNPSFRVWMEDGNTVEIYYKAKLTHDADLTNVGNKNTVILTYGEEPTDTAPETTTTYTNKMTVTKTNENDEALAGAVFTLSHLGNPLTFTELEDNVYVVDPESTTDSITTDESGVFSICGLDTEDEYILEEIEAPDPYILMEPVSVIIRDGQHAIDVPVVNLPGVEMPETGGMGTTVFYVAGGILVLAAVVLLVTKKRMSV